MFFMIFLWLTGNTVSRSGILCDIKFLKSCGFCIAISILHAIHTIVSDEQKL